MADVELLVLDRSEPLTEHDHALLAAPARRRLVVLNKGDLVRAWRDSEAGAECVEVSALTGEGVTELVHRLEAALAAGAPGRDVPRVTNTRHVALLRLASSALARAESLAGSGAAEELVLVELGDARSALDEVTGALTQDDVLARIFERFCIGK
jgi:tRNA modification GTPase